MDRVMLCCLIFALACSSSPSEERAQKTSSEQQVNARKESPLVVKKLVLNDGKKWIANPATQNGMKAMLSAIDAFEGGSKDTAALSALHKTLVTESRSIISQCDMTGEAHEQLHHVLHPMLDLLGKIGKEKNAKHVHELKRYLRVYFAYFDTQE